jgi:hypothetical protein
LALLNQRANCALEVAKIKQAQGELGTFYRPDREALVLRRINTLNKKGVLQRKPGYVCWLLRLKQRQVSSRQAKALIDHSTRANNKLT